MKQTVHFYRYLHCQSRSEKKCKETAREDNTMFVSNHTLTIKSGYRANLRLSVALKKLKYSVYGFTSYLDISKFVSVIAAKHLDIKHWQFADAQDRISDKKQYFSNSLITMFAGLFTGSFTSSHVQSQSNTWKTHKSETHCLWWRWL